MTEPAIADLPAPPRPLRALALFVLALTMAASALTAAQLYPEARYALSSGQAIDVGSLKDADLTGLSGRYVRARVEPAGRAISLSRLGEPDRRIQRNGEAGDRFVEYAVPSAKGRQFVPPHLVAGRLADVRDLGLRHRGLSAHGLPARIGFVLIDGEEPRAAGWAVALELLCAGFFAFGALSIARIVRPRRAADL